jgi:hypothetical protein
MNICMHLVAHSIMEEKAGYFRFSWQWVWRWLSSGLLRHVVWYKFTDISEVLAPWWWRQQAPLNISKLLPDYMVQQTQKIAIVKCSLTSKQDIKHYYTYHKQSYNPGRLSTSFDFASHYYNGNQKPIPHLLRNNNTTKNIYIFSGRLQFKHNQ